MTTRSSQFVTIAGTKMRAAARRDSRNYNSQYNAISANPTKWSNTIKQFVGCCQQIA